MKLDVKEIIIILFCAWFLYGTFKECMFMFDSVTTYRGVYGLMQLVTAIMAGIIWWQYTKLRDLKSIIS